MEEIKMDDETKTQTTTDAPPDAAAAQAQQPDPIVLLEKQLADAQSELGRRATVIGEMNVRLSQAEQERLAFEQRKAEEPDYNQQYTALESARQDGEITEDQYNTEYRSLARKEATHEAKLAAGQEVQTLIAQERAQTEQQKWLAEHPDYRELQKNGTLAGIVAKHPGIEDDISAYHAYHAAKAKIELAEKAKIIEAKSFKAGAAAAAAADAGSDRQDLLIGREDAAAGGPPPKRDKFVSLEDSRRRAMGRDIKIE